MITAEEILNNINTNNNTMTVEAGNRMIAEFLGGKVIESWRSGDNITYSVQGQWVKDFRDSPNNMNTGGMGLKMLLERCQFHSRWDWLMYACKKFDDLYETKGAIPDKKYSQYQFWCDMVDCAVTNYDIDEAFDALCDAIEWYNQTKLK